MPLPMFRVVCAMPSSTSQSNSYGHANGNGGSASVPSQEEIPRDVRLLHLLLASQSIHQYEDQVPLQLMDFAYR